MKIIKDVELAGMRFMHDAAKIHRADPALVSGIFFPQTKHDVVRLLEHSVATNTLVTVRGAGSGLTSACVPTHGGRVMCLEEMLRVRPRRGYQTLDHRVDRGTVRVVLHKRRNHLRLAPGVQMGTLDTLLASKRLWLPPDATYRGALAGGNVATNASGARTFGFGTMRDYVSYLHTILPNGESLRLHRGDNISRDGILTFKTDERTEYRIPIPSSKRPHVFKNTAAGMYSGEGMDLIDLLIGSEGIVGTFVEIGLDLLEYRKIETGLFFFESDDGALDFVDSMRMFRASRGVYSRDPLINFQGIASLEYYDEGALRLARGRASVPASARAAVQYEFFKDDFPTMERLFGSFPYGDKEGWCLVGDTLRQFRESVPTRLNEMVWKKMGTDASVPVEHYREMHAYLREKQREFAAECGRDDVTSAKWGHIGDCHVHLNFIATNEREYAVAQRLYGQIAQKAAELGGTVSSEHNVGKKGALIDGKEVPLLQIEAGGEDIILREIARVKGNFDPRFLANRGNLVPYKMAKEFGFAA